MKENIDLLQPSQYGDCAYLDFEHKIPASTVRMWRSKIKKRYASFTEVLCTKNAHSPLA